MTMIDHLLLLLVELLLEYNEVIYHLIKTSRTDVRFLWETITDSILYVFAFQIAAIRHLVDCETWMQVHSKSHCSLVIFL